MGRITERLDMGLVTSRDPALLSPGELSEMRNAIYLPNSQALCRATGRVAFGVASATAQSVVGIRDLTYDNGDHYLLAHATGFYVTAAVADTGTFATAQAVTPGTSLEAIHSDNQYIILNGTAADLFASATGTPPSAFNYVAYLSATSAATAPSWRTHGLNPVTIAMPLATAAGVFTTTTTGYYWYWTTEIVEYTRDGTVQQLESTFAGDPLSVYVSSTAMTVTIEAPTIFNANATKWRVWRSGKGETDTDKQFPTGWAISPPISFSETSVFIDGAATQQAYVFASATEGTPQWGSSNSVAANDGAYATANFTATGTKDVVYKTFFASAIASPVLGIEIEVEASKVLNSAGTGQVSLWLALSGDGGATYTNPIGGVGSQGYTSGSTAGAIAATESAGPADRVTVLGGPNYLFGRNWTPTELNDTNFRIRLFATARALKPSINAAAVFTKDVTARVDYIKARVYHSGGITGASTEDPFAAVIINQSGLQTSVGSHGRPPIATTGDIYEGQLVLNDVISPSFIRYSLPLEPDYFPPIYFVDFETADNDRVTNIKTLNNRLGVFLKNAAYRVNYLPSENDATFDRGRCLEEVSSSYGCYNSQCATRYTSGDGRTHLAYVSDQGIHTTDLFSVQNLTDDLDWRLIISATATSYPICLINDPEKWELLFYYRNDSYSDTETYRCLHLSYHPRHLKQGNPKISGQVHMRNYDTALGVYASLESAWSVKRSSGAYGVYLGYGGTTASATAAGAGKVFMESGTAIPAYDSNESWTTRRMYLAGEGREWRMNELYVYTPSADAAATEYSIYTVKTGGIGEVQNAAKAYTYDGSIMHKLVFNQIAEGARIHFTQTASAGAWRDEYLVIDGEGFGNEDSGRA